MATRAKWSSSVVQEIGREALALASKYRAELEPRLPAGLVDGLKADLDAFDGVRADASNAAGVLKTATKEQKEAVALAIGHLGALRGALIRSRASAAQRDAFGISKRIEQTKVASVVAALDAFVKGAAKYPDFIRAVGVLPADVETLDVLSKSLIGVDQSQEHQKSARKEPVAQRVATQVRIETAIDTIINTGQLAFVAKPDISNRFKGLTPRSSPRSTRSKSPTA